MSHITKEKVLAYSEHGIMQTHCYSNCHFSIQKQSCVVPVLGKHDQRQTT